MSETRVDPDSGATLVPVDHDPFSEPEPSGYFGKIASDLSDFWQQPIAHVKQRLSDIGQSFSDVAQSGLQRQAALTGGDYSNQPLIGADPSTGELTGRLPALAELVTSGMAGPVPGGGAAGMVLGAGPRLTRGAGELANLDTPISDTLKAGDFTTQLRAQHLARDNPLPLSGATQPISPPPGVQSSADMDALVNHYADLAQNGAVGRDWYKSSGQAILQHAGNPEAADRFAAALSGTSPQTDVAGNAAQATRAWNQAMAGDPALQAGRFPNTMGARVQSYLYGGEPVTGEKIGPFMSALGSEWNPDLGHAFVNDIWNMRALGYPHPSGQLKGPAMINGQPYYNSTPTLGQHNFARIVADRASDVLQDRTGQDWQPQQVQAAAWAGTKSSIEGTPIGDAAFNFADALKSRYAQQSWESAPGETTNNLPEFHSAAPIDQQAYHDAIRGVLEDPQGRDLISQHFGLLTGPSFPGPGVFQGTVRPGSQAQTVTGPAAGGYLQGVDPANRDLLNAAEATRGLLLRQDASAWHQPTFKAGLKPGDSNLADVDVGRPLTTSEAQAAVEAMHQASGSDFFSPIATPNGFRFLNVPEASGVKNVDFQKAVVKALGDDRLPDATVRPAFADSGYIPNEWKENPGGEGYLSAITGTGRPDLERRSAELLATLGPRVSQVEDHFANQLGWTPDRSSRIWENSPQIQRYGQEPSGGLRAPQPWVQQPAAPGSRPPLLVPVDHDPFAGQ
jgi:hypothetical protein